MREHKRDERGVTDTKNQYTKTESRGGDSNHMTEERAVTIKYAAEVKSLRMPSIEADPSLGHD